MWGAKQSKHRSGRPNASSGASMQTPEKSLWFLFISSAAYVVKTRAQLALRTPYGHSSRFTLIYLFLCTLSFYCYGARLLQINLFIIWLNCYVKFSHMKEAFLSNTYSGQWHCFKVLCLRIYCRNPGSTFSIRKCRVGHDATRDVL